MRPKAKFRCKTRDIIISAKRDARIENVVIEKGTDVESIIDMLLSIIGSCFISRTDLRCRIDGEDALIELCASSGKRLLRGSIYTSEEAEMLIHHGFLDEIRDLQNLISTTKHFAEKEQIPEQETRW